MESKNTGLKRIFKATGYSLQGLKAAYKHEAAFRQELVLLVVSVPLIFYFAENSYERILLVVVTVLILVAELVNSAIEAVVDRIGPESQELSGRAKDLGSAVVLVAFLLWGYVWLELLLG